MYRSEKFGNKENGYPKQKQDPDQWITLPQHLKGDPRIFCEIQCTCIYSCMVIAEIAKISSEKKQDDECDQGQVVGPDSFIFF